MREGDILYFAPEIRLREVDLNGSGLSNQYRAPSRWRPRSRVRKGGAVLVLSLVETADVQRFEQFKVAIVRKDGIDAMLPAQGDDL